MDSIELGAEYPVTITNPHKLMWSNQGITKLMYIHYLIQMAPYMLSHYRNRPVTVIRFPDGILGHSFFQKHLPSNAPEWMISKKNAQDEQIFVETVADLLWLGNLGSLEFHVPFSLYQRPHHPTHLAFDLDPTVPGFERVRNVALTLHEVLLELSLPHIAKTSGATGLQVLIPLDGQVEFEQLNLFTRTIAKYLLHKLPGDVTLERMKQKRGNKVYVDFPQFGKNRTLIGVYSSRATEHATVSAPLEWNELERGAVPEDFTIRNMISRIRSKGDMMDMACKANMVQLLDHLTDMAHR